MHAAIQQNSRSPGTCAGFNIIYIYSVCSGAGFLYEDSDIVGTGQDPAPYLNADQDPWL